MSQVVVVVGPIGSGKSTVCRALAAGLRASGRVVAVVDYDEPVNMMGGFAQLERHLADAGDVNWSQSVRDVHGSLVGSWAAEGADVLVQGPFVGAAEEAPFVDRLPAGTALRRLRLLVSYETALRRVASDTRPRNLSLDPAYVRRAHDRAVSPLELPADWTIDTEAMSAQDLADVVLADLLAGGPPLA